VAGEHQDRISGDPSRRRGEPPGLRQALLAIEQKRADVLAVFAANDQNRGSGAQAVICN
jgi:hypothetical protein